MFLEEWLDKLEKYLATVDQVIDVKVDNVGLHLLSCGFLVFSHHNAIDQIRVFDTKNTDIIKRNFVQVDLRYDSFEIIEEVFVALPSLLVKFFTRIGEDLKTPNQAPKGE
jgi:hypothetical protein